MIYYTNFPQNCQQRDENDTVYNVVFSRYARYFFPKITKMNMDEILTSPC